MLSESTEKKDFICTQDWEKKDLDYLLDLTKDIKKNPNNYMNALIGKSLCMFFYNPSTRTRNSTEIAAYQLGMHPTFNSIKDSWIGYQSESIKDTAIVLAKYYNAIGIRIFPNAVNWKYGKGNQILCEFARWSNVPIINFEDDQFHPLQALTDIFTICEKKKDPQGKKIVISWAYHPKPLPLSVVNSTLLIASRYGMDITLAHPKNYELDEKIINIANKNIKESNGTLTFSNNIKEAYSDADVIYVKSWGSIKEYGNIREEKRLRMPYRADWKIKKEYLDYTRSDSIFMHCLPIRRDIVAENAVIDSKKHSVIYEQAENRLYTAKALLYYLLKED
ncbi:MAG: N-acetylornithine carbamoyltransferase [Promethearchaeota archaeon]